MQDGTPPGDPASSEPPVTESTEPTEAEVEEVTSEARTVEEVEAFWKNRVSGKDRSHAAETAELRRQLAEAQTRASTEAQQREQQAGELTESEQQWKQKYEDAEKRATEAEQARVRETRTAKYAAAAEHLDEATLVSMDEAKLAGLNARLTGDEAPAPPPMDPNAPRRESASPPAPRERSVEEMEADLKAQESEFLQRMNG